MKIEILKTFIESANINFLFGSGVSKPYLSTLESIEKWLEEIHQKKESEDIASIVKNSIFKLYFEKVIYPNSIIEEKTKKIYSETLTNYTNFFNIWNEILNRRCTKLLSKQVNIFTTNIDTLVENAAEKTNIEFNDGFKGSVNQFFNESNFQKSFIKTSIHFQNTTELPVFNLLKMHGSINWQENNSLIINDNKLTNVDACNEELKKNKSDYFIKIEDEDTINIIVNKAEKIKKAFPTINFADVYKLFTTEYEKLIIVNPTKKKFSDTVLDFHFYDLMRMYSNSLEKENTILFVMGFSFADEHIAKITERVARTNPTLLIIIFAYKDVEKKDFEQKFKDLINIKIITTTEFIQSNELKDKYNKNISPFAEIEHFDFMTINQVFKGIRDLIPVNFNYGS